MRSVGLRSKLLFANSLIILIVGVAVVSLVKIVFPQSIMVELRHDWTYITERLAEDVVVPVLSRDELGLRAAVFEHKRLLLDAEYIFLADEDGRILAHTFERGFPEDLLATLSSGANEVTSVRVVIGDKQVFDVAAPMLQGKVGEAHIGFTAAAVMKEANRMATLVVLIVIAVLIVQIPLIGMLGAYITRPISQLKELTRQVRRISEGEHGDDVGVTSRDEVGELATAYNAMRGDLSDYRRRLRSLSAQLALAEESERRRIAIELHDVIGQTTAMSKVKLGELRAKVTDPSCLSDLSDIRRMIDRVIEDTRSLVLELSPPVLYELSFEEALEWLCERTEARHDIPVFFQGDDCEGEPEDDVRVVLFQMVRELLTNVAKHSGATRAEISLARTGSKLMITVEDNGAGFDIYETISRPDPSKGFGLFSVRERMDHIGGTVQIASGPDIGTHVVLTVPLKQVEES